MAIISNKSIDVNMRVRIGAMKVIVGTCDTLITQWKMLSLDFASKNGFY